MTFGERLRQLREEKQLTLEEIGDVIGVSRATVYKYEKNQIATVPPDKVHKLANFLGVTRPYLMGWTDERHANPAANLEMVATMHRPDQSNYWKTANLSGADCLTAATQASRALIKFKISRTPIYPHQIIQQSQIATMVSFAEPMELDRIELGTDSHTLRREDYMLMSSAHISKDGRQEYLFAVNRNAPLGQTRLALAIELGHIYLGHVGNRKNELKNREAECFAIHMEFPRPLIKLLSERGMVFTRETFSRIFGDCSPCLDSIINAEPVTISPELNRLLREQFAPYVDSLEEMGLLSLPVGVHDQILDFSQYMAGYEE